MKWPLLAFALLFALPALAQGPATPMTPSPDERAKQWLTLVDDSNYGEAWRQAGSSLRAHADMTKFQNEVGGVRQPMGAMATRTIKAVKMGKTLPGMRDGQYATVQFDSSFAHKAAAVETVTLTSEKGAWSVISYHIN